MGEPVIKFRNYQPKTELDQLGAETVEKAAVPDVEEALQAGSSDVAHTDPTQEPLLNLAPKKVNWDLKRDIEPQMKKLRAATDRAIIELIRERVTKEGGETDLSTAVSQAAQEAAKDEL
ncbi:hypothetical protein EMIHUDRAFT_222615 [Emiliania huxleyi CCMP1516]|uniref:Cwf18 pre-mRNA splicing factor n=2 Tax=Emiliania huxleyi TaxID=2903 RepID=A0A0D3JNE1_EMIH1|nr:hypothetical protein EMIHUDRAFT_115649 [Emiliania huxleyi CCMP1516]XP_005792949.1 hypothetical protein EMIHUDRAFT_222615 [Emiliania huxleyi CCMP1516]EOD25026.1 hypothetical protein EMIHUDRAFT_115649 [Emiliania huxleyi CCMP1516]EOD40520.1 hypothetical protein EMIHUDRAFT_222615 [Emiliania huxleyi CCMP1516]|eukprot:XP_005777455.1 hypothetical protein EMIHUDRAFT_115649 [Emiliania huxleyi CCMP1516]